MNAIIKPETPGAALLPNSFADAVRFAEMMARAHTVPRHLQDSPGDCLMVVEQALRWGMSPFAVAQATSVISGKLMFEGKLVAAAVETSGAITGHLDYEFTGKGEDRAVIVSGTRRGETQPRTVTVALKEARTNNAMWQRQPDQQLVYHGARVWARRWTPAVILGVYSREEMGPIVDVTPEPDSGIETVFPPSNERRDAINTSVPLVVDEPPATTQHYPPQAVRAAAKPTPRPGRIVGPDEYQHVSGRPPAETMTGNGERTDDQWRRWLDKLRLALSVLRDAKAVEEVANRDTITDAMVTAPAWVKREIGAVLAEAYARFSEPEPPATSEDEP